LGIPSTDKNRNSAAPGQEEIQPDEAPEFAATQMDETPEIETSWWAEATDGQCSESAALFAASQPAPLSIV
jgi:hypothetical protein